MFSISGDVVVVKTSTIVVVIAAAIVVIIVIEVAEVIILVVEVAEVIVAIVIVVIVVVVVVLVLVAAVSVAVFALILVIPSIDATSKGVIPLHASRFKISGELCCHFVMKDSVLSTLPYLIESQNWFNSVSEQCSCC
jgi:hypothetical protein